MAQMGQKKYGHVAYMKENTSICGHVAYMGHRKYVDIKHAWEKIYGHAAHMREKIYIHETHITDEIHSTHERLEMRACCTCGRDEI